MAVPVRRDLVLQTDELHVRLGHALTGRLDQLGQRVEGLARGLPRPDMLLGLAAQRLDDLGERLRLRSPAELVQAQRDRLAQRHARLAELIADRLRRSARDLDGHAARLAPELIASRLAQLRPRLAREQAALAHGIETVIDRLRRAVATQSRQLEALSHARVLERGYAIVRGRLGGRVIPRLAALGIEAELDIVFADGQLAVRRADRAHIRGRRAKPDQGSLL
jgi:exodeoxyribonuclease VII large subunit